MNWPGKRVLIFGDSLSASSGSPGGQLAQIIRGQGGDVRVDAKQGRSAYNFFTDREDYASLLAQDRAFGPDLVIVFLGTNDIATGIGVTRDRPKMQAIYDAFPQAKKIAVGPPNFIAPRADLNAGAPAVVDMMRSIFGSNFIDARPLTPVGGRTSDGVHFTVSGAKPFAENIFRALDGLGSGAVGLRGGGSTGAWALLGIILTGVLWWRFRR